MTPQEHAKQARILYESLSRREHLVNRERFESIVSDHIQRALDEQAALRSPAPAATGTGDPFPITNPCGVCGVKDGHARGCPEDDLTPPAQGDEMRALSDSWKHSQTKPRNIVRVGK